MKRGWIAAAAGALLCVAGLRAWSLGSKGAGRFADARALVAGAPTPTPTPTRGGAAMDRAPVLEVPASARQGTPAAFRLSESMVRAALADGVLLVEMPGGIRYPVRMVGGRTSWKGRWTAIGKVATRVGVQSMVLTFGGHDVFGVLPLPDGSQLSIVTSRDATRIAPAGNLIPPGHTGIGNGDMLAPPHRAKKGHPGMAAAQRMAVADDGAPGDVRIDLLGLYSDELVALRGSVETAETEVVHQVDVANQAHADSGTGVRFELKGMKQVQLADPGASNRAVLSAITDAQLEGDLRDELGADLVFLVRPYTQGDLSCGIAWLNGASLGTDFDPWYGYSVINVEPCSPWVLPHELGHNMGSTHDRETATGSDGTVDYGAFAWSFGYRRGGEGGFSTVMAYDEDDMPQVGYFSDPGNTACGSACGIDGAADNVRSLRATSPVIASFRGTPGTALILDAWGTEPIQGGTATITVPVRLNGVAPAGGHAFTVEAVGGNARNGVDYSLPSTSLVMGEGEREADFRVTILGDDVVEGDETIQLRLTSLDGTPVEDAESVVSIVDDDPRVLVHGQARFPAGATPPTTGFQVQFNGVDGGDGGSRWATLSPPDFEYSVPVARHSLVTMYAVFIPEPFVATEVNLGLVESEMEADLPLYIGMRVSGRLLPPQDGPGITGSTAITVKESLEQTGVVSNHGLSLSPGDDFSVLVMPGAVVNITATPSSPYQPYWFRAPALHADLHQDIRFSTLPSLVVWGADDVTERYHTFVGNDSFSTVFALSAPAPEGGVSIAYSTHAGTATAGQDFVPASGTVFIPAGEMGRQVGVEYIDDYQYEPEVESFSVEADTVEGASPTTPVMRVLIHDNDAHLGGPGQKQSLPP